jgi:ABC-type dipeptide/oligopeptide/nickel transport system permease subunit
VTLGTHFMAVLARLTRTSMLEVLGQNYVTTARAKGLPEWLVITTHALKNAAVPVVTLIGLQFGTLLGGAVVTETIFAWPGVGRLAVQSIFVRDYPVVQAGVFVLALSFVGINLLVDLLYGYLDPRIRSEESPASPPVPSSRRRRRVMWALIVPAVPVIIAIGVAVLAPWIAPHSPTSGRLAARLQPPVWQEGGNVARVLGSDLLGRDVLSRLMWGARISLLIALLATLLGAAVGSLIGLVTGYYRGRVDRVITKLIDIQLAFPFVLLAIAVIAVAGPSIPVLVTVLAIGSWVGHARIVRGLVLSLREREYVQAALALGAGTPRVLFRHLVPEILSLILVMATFDVGRIIILESTLSFLGLGVQPPTPSWGSDLRDAAVYVRQAWWMATFPGLAIMLVVLGVNLLGDALRDVLDPRTKKN